MERCLAQRRRLAIVTVVGRKRKPTLRSTELSTRTGGFWPALALAGGVGGATLLALYFVPSAYVLVRGVRLPKIEFKEVPNAIQTNPVTG